MSLHNMVLPDMAQAFKILGAMISDNLCQMALTFASGLSLKSMEAARKCIFGKKLYMSSSNEEISSSNLVHQPKENIKPKTRS